MKEKDEFIKIFSTNIRNILSKVNIDSGRLQEIRLRAGKPLVLSAAGKEYFVTLSGSLTSDSEKSFRVSKREIEETMEYVANYSMYAYEEELRQGFLTIGGGHRVGVVGKAVSEDGHIRSMKYISCINVRIAHEVRGCADAVMPYVAGRGDVRHTLIISPPGCGKTTLLRELIRQVSEGNAFGRGQTVGVVDERSELAGSFLGVPQNDLGIRTDVLDACPKTEGMLLLLRAMSPRVIAIDELGSREEMEALRSAASCGCRILATAHGETFADMERRFGIQTPELKKLFQVVLCSQKKTGKFLTELLWRESRIPL